MRIAVGTGGRAVHDPDATMPGRGAYLCRGLDRELPAADCLARAMRRGGIPRALRAAVTLDPKLVESEKDPARPAKPGTGQQAGHLYFPMTP
jgi:predicted RNA-binding protein YlxR (DUF448 family)